MVEQNSTSKYYESNINRYVLKTQALSELQYSKSIYRLQIACIMIIYIIYTISLKIKRFVMNTLFHASKSWIF